MNTSEMSEQSLALGDPAVRHNPEDTATNRKRKTRLVVGSSQDRRWQADLLGHLSSLECHRARLDSPEMHLEPLSVLAVLVALVNESMAFAAEHCREPEYADELTALLGRSGDFSSAAGVVRQMLQQNQSWFGWLSARPDKATLRLQLRRVTELVVEVVARHFQLCAARFGSLDAVRTWQETSAVFLADLQGMLCG